MTEQTDNLSVENRLLGAIAHGSVVAQGVGILVGVVVYLYQRERSRYTANQALQAAVYQLIILIIVIGMWIVWGVFYGISLIPLIQQAQTMPDAPPPPIFWIGMASFVIPLTFMVIAGLYGLWGAFQTWQRKDFRYVLLGTWLEKNGLWQKDD